ncbi:MAG: hypothetical protein AB7U34_03275 [Novosphingobium sp.]
MDARIILAGQQPDFLGTIDRANTAAARQNEFGRQNALAELYRNQGAQIAQGDAAALNALARFDPSASLGIQGQRQDMAMGARRMEIMNADEKRAAEQYARSLSAAEASAQAAQIEGAVKVGLAAQTPEQWDQVVGKIAPDLVGQFGNRQAIAQRYMGMAEILKGSAQFRQASQQEAAQYGASGGQFGPDGRFYPINPPSGMSVETGPDGQLKIVQGPGAGGASGMKLTEGQSKDLVYFNRASGAAPILDQSEQALTGFGDAVGDRVPLVGNYMTSPQYKQAKQAGEEWLSAILRKDTGAAITKQEIEIYGKMYLPQPGDTPDIITQKREARARATDAIKRGLGTAEILANELVAQRAQTAQPQAKPAGEIGGYKIEEIQ